MKNPLWSEQDVRRVSAESMVDPRTIRRALRGDSVRATSKERIRRAAVKFRLALPSFLALIALGCASTSTNGESLFGSGSSAGDGAAESSLGGAAGAAGSSFDGSAPIDADANSCGELASEASLYADEAILSCDGQATLQMQPDGNLVLYDALGKSIWAVGGPGGYVTKMQWDGNLVVKSESGTLWSSGTSGNSGARLLVEASRVVIVVGETPIWSSP